LKDYGANNQIGYNDSYENYINNLNLVWKESYRVLNKGCRLCINIGDQFARSVYYGRYKVIPLFSAWEHPNFKQYPSSIVHKG
jgi:site-specific DNA-methyltransferase (adenine-specific)